MSALGPKLGIALVLALLALPSSAGAQSASERALARQLFRDGVGAAEEGNWEEARDAFQRAYELDPRPVTLLNYAGALVQTGQLVEGAEAYRSFIATATSGSARRLRTEAERQLAEVEPRIPRLQLVVVGIDDADVIRLDDWEISHAALELGLPVDPGDHVVVVQRGAESRELRFRVGESETEHLEVDFTGVAPSGGEVDPEALSVGGGREPGGESLLESPVFWIVSAAAVVVVGGLAVGLGVGLSSQGTAPLYEGNIPPFQLGLQ